MTTPLTQQAAAFICDQTYEDIPEDIVTLIVNGMTDCAAVIFLGVPEHVTAIVAASVSERTGDVSALWGRFHTSADAAALVNATASHSLDYDDTGLEGHPSAVLFPAVLALGEEMRASGRDIITAYLVGYEIWAELMFRDKDQLHACGFHPTGVLGTVAAAAACAKLLGLDQAKTAAALSISASMASGLTANFGSMTKPYQLGRAVQNGVVAAKLARAGLSAAPDVLEHEGGFLRAYSPNGNIDLDTPSELGKRLWIEQEGLNIKLHPICYAAHRLVNSALTLAARKDLPQKGLKEIRANLGVNQSRMLRSCTPETPLEAKFSAEFCVATALQEGKLGLAETSPDYVEAGAFRPLAELVKRVEVVDSDPEQTLFSPFDRVDLVYEDGKIISGDEIRYAYGHAKSPVTPVQLREKFDECVAGQLDTSKSASLFEAIQSLESAACVKNLVRL